MLCTAGNSHTEMDIAALRAEKHVLCEKYMADALEDSEAMVKADEQVGKLLMTDQNQRMAPPVRRPGNGFGPERTAL